MSNQKLTQVGNNILDRSSSFPSFNNDEMMTHHLAFNVEPFLYLLYLHL